MKLEIKKKRKGIEKKRIKLTEVPLRSLNQGPGPSVAASTNLPTMAGGSLLAASCPLLRPNPHGSLSMAQNPGAVGTLTPNCGL